MYCFWLNVVDASDHGRYWLASVAVQNAHASSFGTKL
jgi:hypothetical protein